MLTSVLLPVAMALAGAYHATATTVPASAPRWVVALQDRCPESPSNLTMLPGVQRVRACSTPPPVDIHGLQSTARGWIAYTSYGLEAIAEDGRVRWRYDNRSSCHLYYGDLECTPLVTDFAATADGGAWVLEDTGFPESHYLPDRLRRIRSDGTPGQAVDLATMPYFTIGSAASYRMVSDGSDGVALFWANPFVGWQHIGQLRANESGVPAVTAVPIGPALPEIDQVLLLPDGDALIEFTPNADARHCAICTETARMSAARVSPSGGMVWRTDSAIAAPMRASVSRDGIWISDGRIPATLQRIDREGTAGAVLSIAGLGQDQWNEPAAGQDGELLLQTSSGVQRVGTTGSVLSYAPWEGPGTAVLRTQPGPPVVVPGVYSAVPDVFAFDAVTLAPQLRGYFDERPSDGPVMPYVSTGFDGAIGTLRTYSDDQGLLRSEVGRFDVPGSIAEARLHRHGFEP